MAGRRRTPATQQRQSSILVWLGGGNGVDPSARSGHEQENGADARCRRRHVWPCCQRMRVSLADGSPVCGSHGLGPLDPGTALPLALAWTCTGVTP